MNVGDYVRFKDKRGNTYIRQIKDLPQDIRYGAIKIDIEANYSDMLSPKNVIKSSPNIIDLIEIGDYVNGYDVEYVDYKDKMVICYGATLDEEDIKSIVTREMFERMEYKL